MTIYEKLDVLRESLNDYLSLRHSQATVFGVCGSEVTVYIFRVKIFTLTERELKPSLLDMYAYIIARIIHTNRELAKIMVENGEV